ncbi:MAG: asparagine synthase (glutamine-hydrolyzing) [Verrucomicrobiota bacterium]
MCGIFGGWSQAGSIDREKCRAALARLKHRGPDAGLLCFYEDGSVCLGHQRLKIIDLHDRANQPMRSACGRYDIIYNGEIYNFQELKATLGSYHFKTTGDTEVLLALYACHGAEMLPMLNGMFAFAIFDHRDRVWFLARDRYGIKPLYYYHDPVHFVFASEIPPLLKFANSEPDLDVIKTYLASGNYDFGERTFFKHIQRLNAGACLRLSMGGESIEMNQWHCIEPLVSDPPSPGSQGEWIEELDGILSRSVQRHLITDVPVGINISGGLDSSTLLHYVDRHHPRIDGYTQDYDDPYSERVWVESAASRTGANLHMIHVSSDKCRDVFEDVMHYQAEPFGGIPVIGFYFLYQQASENGTTVLLDGNGIDEIMLGYKKYHFADLAQQSQTTDYSQALASFCQFWGESPDAVNNRIAHILEGRNVAIDGTVPTAAAVMGEALADVDRIPLPDIIKTGSKARDLALEDLMATKIPRALRFNDRVSMMFSKELRVPFLDNELVDWSLSLPVSELVNRFGTKALLRHLMAGHLDPEVARAPKRMVQSPQREWLAGAWRPWVEDILNSRSIENRGWIDADAARERYRRYCDGEGDNSFFIWQWINLEVWARQYLD